MPGSELNQLIGQIRRAFQDLKTYVDRLHVDSGVNASMRAVLEYLGDDGAASVPQIARDKNVSRQHIQIIADRLREDGLVRLRDNPAHKRSALIAMTARGRTAFQRIRVKEQVVLQELGRRLDPRQLAAAVTVIGQLRDQLKTLEETENATSSTR